MLHINENFIKRNCGQISYEKGVKYYTSNKVQNVSLMHKKDNSLQEEYILIKGDVEDSSSEKFYNVEIRLYFKPQYNEFLCGCKSERIKNILCEHCAAVLTKCVREQRKMVIKPDDCVYKEPVGNEIKQNNQISDADKEQAEKENKEVNKSAESKEIEEVSRINEYIKRLRIGTAKEICNTRKLIKLKIIYEIEKGRHIDGRQEYYSYIKLKVGRVSAYVVKDVLTFLKVVSDGNGEIEIGKGFTYNPQLHYFDESAQKIIDFLITVYDSHIQAAAGDLRYYDSFRSQDWYEKLLPLTERQLKKFFELMMEESFEINAMGFEFRAAKVVQGNIPMQFQIKSEEQKAEETPKIEIVPGSIADMLPDKATELMTESFEDKIPKTISIENKSVKKIISLTSKNDYFLYDGTIYKPDTFQSNLYTLFYDTLFNNEIKSVTFDQEEIFQVFSYIVPALRKNNMRVKMDQKVEELFVEENLNTQIYIDKEDQQVQLKVVFNYGDISVNHSDKNSQHKFTVDGSIVIRDAAGENRIINLIDAYGFKEVEEQFILDEEEKIVDFILEGIDELRKSAEVYLSESFKRTKVYSTASYKSSVRLESNTWLEFGFNIENVNEDEVAELMLAIKHKKRYFKLKNQNFINLEADEFTALGQLVERLHINPADIAKGKVKLPKFSALYIEKKLSESNLHNVERDKDFLEMVRSIKEPEGTEYPVPEGLKGIMRTYQQTGFKWLKTLDRHGFGGVLADEMGLGKTLQALSYIQSKSAEYKNNGRHELFLIVVPTSLLFNWRDEAEKFTPDLKTLVIEGSAASRRSLLREIENYDLIITSYALIRNDIVDYLNWEFDMCILDEAQNIKNPNSLSAAAVKQIKARSYYALTGTPMENSLTELWSIFDFILPGYLGSHDDFSKEYAVPISKQGDQEALQELNRHIRPFILRRLKKDVLKELPPKIEHKMMAEMTEEQKKLYLAYLNSAKEEVDEEIQKRGFRQSRFKILSILMRLRQICCDPSVFMDNFEGESGKMLMLDELLQESIEGGHRVLVFSQFTSVLKNIEKRLQAKEIEYMYIDGSTKSAQRLKKVKEFNEGYGSVFLISLRAGGLGLNLTGADQVIHFDPWWNPAVEDQATDRAHRIGQKNTVEVIKLIARGTIEEKIFELQEKKKEMIKNVIDHDVDMEEYMVSSMSQEEIESLFE